MKIIVIYFLIKIYIIICIWKIWYFIIKEDYEIIYY